MSTSFFPTAFYTSAPTETLLDDLWNERVARLQTVMDEKKWKDPRWLRYLQKRGLEDERPPYRDMRIAGKHVVDRATRTRSTRDDQYSHSPFVSRKYDEQI